MDQSHRLSVVSDLSPQKYNYEEEVDIRVLLLGFYSQRRFILSIVTAVTLVAVVLAYIWPKSYEVEAITSPPELESFKALNRNSIRPYALEEVYSEYFNKLIQIDITRRYFEKTEFYKVIFKKGPNEVFTAFDIDNAYSVFQKNFQVEKIRLDYMELKKDEKTPLTKVSIKLRTRDPVAGAEFINGFIAYAEQETLQKFSSDQLALKQLRTSELEDKIKALKEKARAVREAQIAVLEEQNNAKILALQDKLSALLKEAEFNREARIAQLKEALTIAKALGIDEPRSLDDYRPESKNKSQVEVSTHLDKGQRPLYLMGAKFLSAEIEQLNKRTQDEYFVSGLSELQKELILAKTDRQIEALKLRKDDYMFIEGLPEIQNQLAALELATLDFSGISLYRLEQKAYIPRMAVSPNKKLMVAGALVSSLMLALCLAFVRILFKNELREQSIATSVAADSLREQEKVEFDPVLARTAVKVAGKVASSGKS